uniref:Zinc finger protein 410 n=1 Tax=Cynoglossus semilaevis TaxID=244447 RepID=A0A3P8UIV1_CYNSE
MLSDELDSKPELLVQFVQNASIPLVQGLEESESKLPCLPLLTPVESSLCSPLDSTSLSDFRGVSEQSPLVHLSFALIILFYGNSSSSFCSLQGITSSSETLIFAADGAGEDGDDGVSSGDYGIDGCAPWYLRVQELAHDSLIAATRAQLARDAKANQDARAASDHTHSGTADGEKREPATRSSSHLSKQILRCSFEGCCRTFTWPAHLKYHLKTHRNDRMFRCGAEGCGKSFYVLQRLQVHMRTHNGEKPFICKEKNCGKKFTTAGNLKNHRRIHTGEKPFLCEADGCGRSFAEYSSLRKHMLVHSGEKPHHCGICGKTFSQSGSRNVHMRKRHGEEGLGNDTHNPMEWNGYTCRHAKILSGV